MDTFESAAKTYDESGNVCQLNHLDAPFRANAVNVNALGLDATGPISAKAVADAYLQEAIPHFGLKTAMLQADDNASPMAAAASTNEHLLFDSEKSVMGNSRVTYNQTMDGIPVWESGIVVQVEEAPMQVIGSQSTVKRDLTFHKALSNARFVESRVKSDTLRQVLGIAAADRVTVHPPQRFVYQFNQARRLEVHYEHPSGEAQARIPFALRPVSQEIVEGDAYVVSAVEFTIDSTHTGQTSWLALVEQNTGSVLMLRSLQGCECCTAILNENPVGILRSHADGQGATGATDAQATSPKVAFFDIGDTLGKSVISSGQLVRIDVFPDAFEVVKELFEKGFRVGVISDPGSLSTTLITSLLQDTGILAFMDRTLLVYGAKNSQAIFESSAALASLAPTECLFVGENAAERAFAEAAGFKSVSTPGRAVNVMDPAAALAWVYLRDPRTKLGSSGPGPAEAAEGLDRHRDLVSLVGLKPAAPGTNQSLAGEYVRLIDVDAPSPVIPSSPLPGDFRFSVTTNDFGAVNAYYNCDRLFRILEDFGIDVPTYFEGTTFPVRVDHRVQFSVNGVLTANVVNASAPGFSLPPRSDGFRFALAALNSSVCMASDWRVVLHEFGHALLWTNVGSPNFRFGHSAGDAIAAIFNDDGNAAPRAVTFPWVEIGRSHQRAVSNFAWYGTRYNPFVFGGTDEAGYVAEQMLSSTLFRVYQAAGGDSDDRHAREFAAAYVVFLIVKSIGLMSPTNNPQRPEGFADLLMQADTGTFRFRGQDRTIGVLRKAIRWAFEMQGAYRQPPAAGQTPTNQIGNPPQVDVFINDGRDGHYPFQESVSSVDIWNRQSSDNGTVHQDPVLGQDNFAYVRVSNRGVSPANGVEVRAFQATAPSNQLWPDDWASLVNGVLVNPAAIAPGNSVVVGPFEWTPNSIQPTLLMSASTTADSSNLPRFASANPIDTNLLARLDNNTSLRAMTAVAHGFA